MQVMAMDFLTTYKYGWKTSYYQNTYDAKKDGEDELAPPIKTENLINDILTLEEENCESCTI